MQILNPLEQYRLTFRDKFREVAEKTFEEIAEESRVDIEANRVLCHEISDLQGDFGDVKRKLTTKRWICWLIVAFVVGSVIYILFCHPTPDSATLFGIAALIGLVLLLSKIIPSIKNLKKQKNDLQGLIEDKNDEAWAQMEPLNRLFDWDIFYRMSMETVPNIQFDEFVPRKRLYQLQRHGMSCNLGDDTAVVAAHSGTLNGNPFVIYRKRAMVWGTRSYTGTKTIHWTTREIGSDGKSYTRHHSQTLTATITRPYPEYHESSQVVYGHSAAPDLTFHRTKNKFNYTDGGLLFSLKKNHLQRKSRKLDAEYAMGTNDEFEVLFTTTDRNDSRQFFLLFTPLAQQNIVGLLRDTTDAYGDDFEFIKQGEINKIIPAHLQSLDLELNPAIFKDYDFDNAKANFTKLSCNYFRSFYFAIAPLLCVPLYQDAPEGYMTDTAKERPADSSHWEHETLAYYWGEDRFCHPDCVTSNILKTQEIQESDGTKQIAISAYGYGAHPRVTYVDKFGGDGRFHSVPVHWDEYYPVTGSGTMTLKEIEERMSDLSPAERYDKAAKMTAGYASATIRRNIISSLQ